MLKFVFRRMWNRKWMIAGLLIGNLLMTAIAAAVPMYSHAILQRVLTRNLSDSLIEQNRYPGNVTLLSPVKKTWLEGEFSDDPDAFPLDGLIQGTDVLYRISSYYNDSVSAKHFHAAQGERDDISVTVLSQSDITDHIQIINGQMYSDLCDGHTFDVIVNEKTFMSNALILGEELELSTIKDQDGTPYRVRISGIFKSNDPEELYWTTNPEGWGNTLVMDENLAKKLFCGKSNAARRFSAKWVAVLDYTSFTPDDVPELLARMESWRSTFKQLRVRSLDANFEKVLQDFLPLSLQLDTTLWVLQVPVLILLAAFIFMVSGQLLFMEQNEISVYKSRGAAKNQIIRIYLLQSLIIALISLTGGLLLGMLICRVLGSSNSFLSFVSRAALPVKITGLSVGLAAGAALLGMCAMVIPVLRYADVDIVSHKRKKSRAGKRPRWQLFFLDFLLLAVSLYGLYQFNQQKDYLARRVMDGAALDPLLYFCSSLFMLGCALLVLRLFPLVVGIIFRLGQKWWTPAAYASFLRITRSSGSQGFIMVFMILTVSIGIFNTRTARTINTNAEEKIRYSIGADLVMQEVWTDNQANSADPSQARTSGPDYTEPDFGKYQDMEEVESATKVLTANDVTLVVDGGKLSNVTLMAINTKEFGETAWFKSSLLPIHWYEYLNAMSQNSRAVLVSSNFRDNYGFEVGDVINYKTRDSDYVKGIIYGFVDYWPSYAPVTRTKGSDGLYKETDNYLIVAHLSQLQASWGITPYQVWMKTRNGSSAFLYEYADENQLKFTVFEDTAASLVELKNEPVFQGTNGILTVGFICVLLLCSVGFLIYWILSIRSRTLQFGIFRAMGMSMREVVTMLLVEQFFLTGCSIGAGAAVGALASRFYVPLIQIAYSAADQVIPLEIVSLTADYIRLFAVIGIVILICMIILGVLISKIKISQALKLGED